MTKIKDLTGQRFGRLLVVAKNPVRYKHTGRAMWDCLCDCGNTTTVPKGNLTSGNTKSCGCLRKDKHLKHGLSQTKAYVVWNDMLARCYRTSHIRYPNYGGRGITVCDRWKNSVEAFVKDMGQPPDGMTIERENNNKGYEPGNCVWADKITQARNTRASVFFTVGNKTQTMAAWAEELETSASTLKIRLRLGWSVEKAMTFPVQRKSRSKPKS